MQGNALTSSVQPFLPDTDIWKTLRKGTYDVFIVLVMMTTSVMEQPLP